MRHVFVWTLNDIMGLVALGVILIIVLGGLVLIGIDNLRAKWRKRK